MQKIQYDPYLIPPNLELAKTHSKAKSIGFIIEKSDRCPCCNMIINKIDVSLNCETQRLSFLGIGYPLFFQSIRLYTILLMLMFALIGIYNIITTVDLCYNEYHFNLIDDESTINSGCYHFIGIAYSINKSNEQLTIQCALALIGSIIITIGLFLIKYYQQKGLKHSTEISASDFTILMRNLPFNYTNEEIKQYFYHYFKTESEQIIKIIRPLNVEEYLQMKSQKIELLSEWRRMHARFSNVQQMQNQEKELSQMKQDIQLLDTRIQRFEQQIAINVEFLQTDYALVIFKEDSEPHRILDITQKDSSIFEIALQYIGCCECCLNISTNLTWKYINNKRVFLKKAPEPLDIIWGNLNWHHNSKIIRRYFGILLNLLVIIIGAFIVYGISYTQNEVKKNGQNGFYLNYLLSALCALAILIVNYILETVVKITTKFEKHSTYTHETRSIVITQTLMQFINTALIPFGLFIFTDFDQNNLAASLFFIFLGNLIILPLLEFFDPLYILKIRLRRKIIQQTFKTEYTQQQANEIYEGPDYRIADKYSTIYKSILMSIFYLCIFPYGSLIQAISLILYYWACKYTLLRRCSWPPNLNRDLNDSIQQILAISPILISIGSICYEFVLVNKMENLIMQIFNLIASTIYSIGYFTYELKFRSIDTDSSLTLNYYKEEQKFSTDYQNCNPVTINIAHIENQLKQE